MREQLYRDIYRAEMSHWWFRSRLRIVTSLLQKFAPAQRPLRIADVGCGSGSSFHALSKFGSVTGIDCEPLALEFSRERGHPLLVAAALPSLPFADDAFDVVCALDVLEHIENDRAAAQELWRICRPGGIVIVTVPAYQWLWSAHDEINDHKRRYTRRELQACLAKPEAEFLKLSYMNTLLAPPLMAVRLLQNLRRNPKTTPEEAHSDVYSVPPLLNSALELLFSADLLWLNFGRLPFGISIIAIARKSSGHRSAAA